MEEPTKRAAEGEFYLSGLSVLFVNIHAGESRRRINHKEGSESSEGELISLASL